MNDTSNIELIDIELNKNEPIFYLKKNPPRNINAFYFFIYLFILIFFISLFAYLTLL